MNDMENYETEFMAGWTGELIKALEDCGDKNNFFGGCADYHYHQNRMEDILKNYKENLEGFLQFLEREWGWIIHISKDKTVITIDENKEECVCPVVHAMEGKVSGIICCCSEKFAQKMFSVVTGKNVQAKVIRSVIRDGKSCIYEIRL